MDHLSAQLNNIEERLDDGTYQPGPWQSFLKNAQGERGDLSHLVEKITRVSNKLHRRNGYIEAPAWVGFAFEASLLMIALTFLTANSLYLKLFAAISLTLALQPSLKVGIGLLLGLRYAYVYLWYFEPRFKMQYGRYLALPYWKKNAIQLAGCLGTPTALALGAYALRDTGYLYWLFTAGALITAIMQVTAFAAAWFGFRRIGSFLLSDLTTPAKLASEIKNR